MSMKPLYCDGCGQRFLVEKFSAAHTSIQWTASASSCPSIRSRGLALGAAERSCPALRDRIERAVLDREIHESTIDEVNPVDMPRLY